MKDFVDRKAWSVLFNAHITLARGKSRPPAVEESCVPGAHQRAQGGTAMGIAASIVELLKRERIPYTWFHHKLSYTAQEEAAASHIRGRCWAKVVVCMLDGQPAQAILPAHYMVDLEKLRVIAGATALRLAREDEIARLYPDLEVGAMPPFGAIYGHRAFVERCLVGEPEMVFNAGTHTDAIRMHYGDFAALARPVVGEFCECRTDQRATGGSSPEASESVSPRPRSALRE